jgi:hypothetical protein
LYPENQIQSASDHHSHNESGIEVISDHGDHSSQDGSVNVVRMSEVRPSTPVEKKQSKNSDSDSDSKKSNSSSGSQEKLVGKKTGAAQQKSKRSASVPHIPRTCGWPVIGAPMTTIPTMIVPQVYATTTTTQPSLPTQMKNLNVKAAEFVPRKPKEGNGPTVQNTGNGRVLTSLAVRLTPSSKGAMHRNTKKLDLTGRRHTLTVEQMKAMKMNTAQPKVFVNGEPAIFTKPEKQTRASSPSASSDSSNNSSSSSDQSGSCQPRLHKYSRDYLLSLRETRKALQLPKQLPNIPELIPTSKTPVLSYNGPRHSGGGHQGRYQNKNKK